MTVLFDTNLLLRAAQPGHALQQHAVRAGDVLKARGEILCVAAQVIYEYWAVATRPPGENGLGIPPADAKLELARIKRLFQVLPETAAILPVWEELIAAHEVRGKSTYDARLVAAMKVHGVSQVVTFNGQDFARYPGITILDPAALV